MPGAAVANVLSKRDGDASIRSDGDASMIQSSHRGYISSHSASSMLGIKCEDWIEVNDLKQVMKDMDRHEKGFDRLLGFLAFLCLFFIAHQLKYDTAFTYSVNSGLLTAIESVTFGDDYKTYADVRNQNDLVQWFSAMAMDLYKGDDLEDICRMCTFYTDCTACNVFNLQIPECEICQPTKGDEPEPKEKLERRERRVLSDKQQFFDTVLPHCFDGTCSNHLFSTQTAYPYDWDTTPVSNCWDEWTVMLEKGVTSSVETMFNAENASLTQVPYSSTSGKIANNVKLGSSAALTWKRVPSSECMNEAVQSLYGKCKDYNSLIKENIDATDANMFISPSGQFQFNEEAQANGVYIDLGSYNFGGWLGYCTAPVLQASDSLENVESVDLTMIAFNAQGQGLISVINVGFEFTPGGYIRSKIDISSFPHLQWNDDTTAAEHFYWAMNAVVCLLLPVGIMLFMQVKFLYQNRNAGWKLKYYLICSWMEKPIQFWFVVNMYMVMACAISSLSSSIYFTQLVNNDEIQFGDPFDFSLTTAAIAQIVASSALVEGAVIRFFIADALFFVTILTLLILLLHIMSFHKRLALVKEVVLGAALDLAHFFFVFLVIMAIFSMIVTTVFGPRLENFNTLSNSLKILLRIGFGDAGEYYDEFMEFPKAYIGPCIVFAIQTIVSLLMLNMLISISVDAYLKYKDDCPKNYWTVFEDFGCYLCRKFLRMQAAFCCETRSLGNWQSFCCTVFSQKQHSSRIIALSVALRILESTPCHRHYAKRALKPQDSNDTSGPKRRSNRRLQRDSSMRLRDSMKAKMSDNKAPSEKNTSELHEVKNELKDAKKEIQRLNALLHLHNIRPEVDSPEEKTSPSF